MTLTTNQVGMYENLQIIVQAGGRGSRLRHHTWNKPKCLVSVRGKPLIYHLFERYPLAKFHIIGDYAFDQLEKYLNVNPPGVKYELIQTTEKGTASGIKEALNNLIPSSPLLIIWSDLILGETPKFHISEKPVVIITSAFTCRWSIGLDGNLQETPSTKKGIPGIFYFSKASLMPQPPTNGEFVKWFSAQVNDFEVMNIEHLEELGDFSSIEESNDRAGFSRFFNKVEIKENTVKKTVIDPNYDEVHQNEISWYEEAEKLNFRRIPKIITKNPLVMERIKGQHAYQMTDLTDREKGAVLADYLDSLIALHDMRSIESNQDDIRQVYITKTRDRVFSVSKLIPGFDRSSITINGKKCRNLFSEKYKEELENLLPSLKVQNFVPVHGDATFSNTLIDERLRVWFIDPRGYFAKKGIFGDANYDFAKVYYSAVGGYDAFNRRKFKVHLDDETVEIIMEEPSFAKVAENVFYDYFGKELNKIKIIHGLIWLALSGYAKDDIDSVIGSFYLGLYWLEDSIN